MNDGLPENLICGNTVTALQRESHPPTAGEWWMQKIKLWAVDRWAQNRPIACIEEELMRMTSF